MFGEKRSRCTIEEKNMMRNLQKELEAWDGYSEAWRPKSGDIPVGVIESYDVHA
jgi:hypothetical protein